MLEANAAGAVLAAARGNLREAAARLGENARVAEAAVAQWPEPGLRMLLTLAVLPLAELERLRGNPARAALLDRLAQGIEAIDRSIPAWKRGGVGLAGDPRALELLARLQADTILPEGLRRAVLEAAGDGVCLNPREWLTGGDPARPARLAGLPLVPEPFRRRGLGGFPDRLRYCTEQGSALPSP
jgi:hypothetical protein